MSQAAKPVDRSHEFLSFVQQQALTMRADDAPPPSFEAWQAQRLELRKKLIRSWGGFPKDACPLEPRVLGELKRDGYRVQKLTLQTRPGVLMTANAYIPDGNGRRAAVLSVHGHWRKAKQEPVVQSRCIGLAKLGFFVLMVDAFGAGERGINKPLGEYHGEMVASTLWPSGLTLAGLQVYDNMRAVDYLQSRPEVNAEQIGVTGASGGGNQTMYVGAIDERLKCVVPVCSVGTYQAYLGAACCMCEVTPSALSYTEEAGVLSLVAPRGLMLVNATRDGFQFSVGEAKKSLAAATKVFQLYGKEDHARHAIFESNHDYSRPMREAMYGWMTRHLKGEGDGTPITEPDIKTEEAEALRCFPGDSRPDSFVTLPMFAAAEGRRLLKQRAIPRHAEQWETDQMLMRESLPRILGGLPKRTPMTVKTSRTASGEVSIEFQPESGITVLANRRPAKGTTQGLALLLDLGNGRKAADTKLATELTDKGWDLVTADLRATGGTAQPGDTISRAPDHNTAEWSMWIGRPLLGQWVWDVSRLLDALGEHAGGLPKTTAVIGIGPASLVALCSAALERRINRVATVGGLASYVSDKPYEKQRMGILAPGILRDVGDVAHLASLCAPKRLVIAGGVTGDARALSADALEQNFSYTRAAFKLERTAGQLRVSESAQPDAIVKSLS
ncbi:MAG: acetylxylan esterase [Planctomycetaceae bacterium]|jgi:dienelactone hydrolase|nr:acetylxylan esterase [Planctomycetaceae bacterium]MBT6157629.1 acetylxylan esterase [Planctomycetaceae bacterium]MBT6483569.1 acetylxylan esterase [Planctomycetaceae bacterium]MBT6495338.1 acetylxylan esterase [Planctomycetaceae bacterium]